jgi:anti-sigma-K factor RskA
LTGFVTRSAGGTITTRYTAWDAVGASDGRHDAVSGQYVTGEVRYDDKALTETQTTTTQGITSVISNTYDQFGNMRGSTSSVDPRSRVDDDVHVACEREGLSR